MKTKKYARTLLMMFVLMAGVLTVGPTTYNVEALGPHVVKGSIYEKNATDVWVIVDNATVTILNTRTDESKNTTANTTGYYAFNLLNLPSGWSYGDTIQVTAYNATNASGTNSTQLALGATNTTIDVYIGITEVGAGVNFFVMDNDGYALDNALINIKDSSNDTIITKRTSVNGKASTNLSNGIYYISIDHKDYDEMSKILRVHGPSNYAFIMGEVEIAGEGMDLYTWLLYLAAFLLILSLLIYGIMKYKKKR